MTRLLPGGHATQTLANQGARVIKVEQPGEGDYARTLSPAVFEQTNAGKQSVAIDLKRPEGRQVLRALLADADILVEGFRPGAMARLGLDYAVLAAEFPRLIYVSLTGYGQTGEYAGLAGHDINYIAMGGVLAQNLPVIPGVQLGDLVGGSMQAVIGILLALQERHLTGRGRHVDVSMTAGVLPLLAIPLADFQAHGHARAPGDSMLTGRYACYHLYEARDGRWLAVGALETKFWAELCRRLGCEELIALQFDDSRQADVKSRLAAIFKTQDAEAWFEQLRAHDCCVTPVRTVEDLEAPAVVGRPPGIGEHTRELLRLAGYSDERVDELKAMGAIACLE